jgi:hypothetical protein
MIVIGTFASIYFSAAFGSLDLSAVAVTYDARRRNRLNDLVKPMRVELVIYMGEHIADPVVPFLRRLVEPEVSGLPASVQRASVVVERQHSPRVGYALRVPAWKRNSCALPRTSPAQTDFGNGRVSCTAGSVPVIDKLWQEWQESRKSVSRKGRYSGSDNAGVAWRVRGTEFAAKSARG